LAVGLYDESWRDGCEDWDLWLTMAERGYRGVILPEVLFHYRRRADSMSREMNRPARQLGLFRRLVEKHGESYRARLLDLLQRRETNLCDLAGEVVDLEQEHHDWWQPELERRRAEAAKLHRRVEEVRRHEAEKAERQRLEADLEGHRQALRNADEEITTLRRIQSEHLEERGHLEADLEGHRQALRNADEEIATLRRIQSEHLEERRHLQADLEGHRQALDNADKDLAALRRSRSWRLTAPLRWLGRGRS
jgi:chromosome segregation ATPase